MASEPEITDGLSDDELADLARLADGTMPVERRAEVEARVAASPQLTRMLERQATAVARVRATVEVGAPARLRAAIDRRRASGHPARRRLSPVRMRVAVAARAAAALAFRVVPPAAVPGRPRGPA